MKRVIKTMILTVMMIMTMITTVGCKADNEPKMTNDLLYRETRDVYKVSEISQYL